MRYEIPGQPAIELKTLILDLNGTLAVQGKIPAGVKPRLTKLRRLGYRIVLLTGNTRNNAHRLARDLKIDWLLARDGEEKRRAALELDPTTCVSIGNGRIDLELMAAVKLRIVTLQREGVHVQTLINSDVVVPCIVDALDLLLDPATLVATLRS